MRPIIHANSCRDMPACILASSSKKKTYGELAENVDKILHLFRKLGP